MAINPIHTDTLEVQARTVSPEFIGKAHKILCSTGDFYLVENERGDVDENGDLIEYRVDLHAGTCTCKAGSFGFLYCRNGFCKHILWATAAELEESTAMAEIAIAQATAILQAKPAQPAFYGCVNGVAVTEDEYKDLFNRTPAPTTNVKFPTRKPFSLMR